VASAGDVGLADEQVALYSCGDITFEA